MRASNSTGCEAGKVKWVSTNHVGAGIIVAIFGIFIALRLRGIISYALAYCRLFGIVKAPESTWQQAWAVRSLAVLSSMTGILKLWQYCLYLYGGNSTVKNFALSIIPGAFSILSYNLW